jgi:hypothetical protein
MDSVKHAPRWTWYTVAGVTLGTVGLKFWKGRAVPAATQTAADGSTTGDTGSGSVQPATTGSSPPGVIVPPIIMGGSSVDTGSAIVGPAFTDLAGLLGTVVTGNQANINTLIGQQGQQSSQIIDLLAGAGQPPQPISVQGPPVNVVVQAPPAAAVSSPPSAKCPPTFPNHNPANGPVGPKSCFKNCSHDECHNGKKSRANGHCYQDGSRQSLAYTVIGGKC